MYAISIERTFSAAHALRLYDGSLEPLHGHDWKIHLTVEADELDQIDVVMDFHDLERMVDGLIQSFHNGNLNSVAPFADEQGALTLNPTAERVAWWLGTQVAAQLPKHVRLGAVRVEEAPGCTAAYRQ